MSEVSIYTKVGNGKLILSGKISEKMFMNLLKDDKIRHVHKNQYEPIEDISAHNFDRTLKLFIFVGYQILQIGG